MFITVKSVDIENKGKYNQATVTYLDKGEEKTRKVVSFGDSSDAYHELKNAKDGDSFNIELKKDGKFWNWVGAERATNSLPGSVEPTNKVPVAAGWRPDPERESRVERQRKQVFIVRQSSISAALEWFKLNPKIEDPSIEQTIDVARQFEEYVFEKQETT